MQKFQKILEYVLKAIFIFGWAGFYTLFAVIFFRSILSGNLYHGGKPTDMNFYIYLVWFIATLVIYTMLFRSYIKEMFINKPELKESLWIIIESFSLVTLLFATYYIIKPLSIYLNIAHLEEAFWYNS